MQLAVCSSETPGLVLAALGVLTPQSPFPFSPSVRPLKHVLSGPQHLPLGSQTSVSPCFIIHLGQSNDSIPWKESRAQGSTLEFRTTLQSQAYILFL